MDIHSDFKETYKILVLIKGLGLGGAERLIVDSLPYLDRECFEYHFAYLLPWKNFLVAQIEAAGFPVHCLEMRSNYHLPLMLPRLQALQRQYQFDLIHADMPLAGILARVVGRGHGVPVVYTEHVTLDRYHVLTRWANRATYGWNRGVLAIAQEIGDSLKQAGLDQKTQVKTLLNTVPVAQVRAEANHLEGLRAELGIPEGHLIVGTVAVFRRQKRLQDWLAAAAQIASRREDVTFLLVGHGPEEATLKRSVETLKLSRRVCLPGFRPDARRLMGLMDVYLMSSDFEGLPIALLEAMALGKPVVSTAVGGIPELIPSAEEGLLTSVGDIEALTQHTLALLDDPERRRRIGQQAARKIESQFDVQHRVQFIENFYLEILQENRERGRKGVRLSRV